MASTHKVIDLVDQKANSRAAGRVKGPADLPVSVELARKGVRTSQDAAMLMSAVCTDTLQGFLPVELANASANAMGKMLKAVEMQFKYGRPRQARASIVFGAK